MRPALMATALLAAAACGRTGMLFEEPADAESAWNPRTQFPDPQPTPPPIPFCDATDPDLAGCWTFDGDVRDRSSNAHVVTTAGTAFASGVSGSAVLLSLASSISVADSAAFDSPTLTIEAWINPSTLPANRITLLDLNGCYGVFIQPNGTLSCVIGGVASANTTAGAIAPATWTHIACRYDAVQLAAYVHGRPSAAVNATNPPNQNGDPLRIGEEGPSGGDQIVGRVDSLRMWRIARTPADLCAAAACE